MMNCPDIDGDGRVEAEAYVRGIRHLCAHAGCPDEAAVLIAADVPLDDAMIDLAVAVRASRVSELSAGHKHEVVSVHVH